MSELDKLEKYLKEHNIPYDRIDEAEKGLIDRHQILVKDKDRKGGNAARFPDWA